MIVKPRTLQVNQVWKLEQVPNAHKFQDYDYSTSFKSTIEQQMGADGDKMYLIGSSDCNKMGLTYTSDKSKAQEFTFIPSVEEGVFFIQSETREKCSRNYISIKKCEGDSKIDFWS